MDDSRESDLVGTGVLLGRFVLTAVLRWRALVALFSTALVRLVLSAVRRLLPVIIGFAVGLLQVVTLLVLGVLPLGGRVGTPAGTASEEEAH